MLSKKIIFFNLKKLTKQEIIVANFVIKKGFKIINTSITEIVKQTNTSLGTVNRTFSKLGFNGLKFYKMFLFSKMNQKQTKNSESAFQKDHLILSLKNFYNSVNYNELNKIANLIENNKNSILMIGEGFSYHVMKIFANKLSKIFYKIKAYDEESFFEILNTKILIIISSQLNSKRIKNKIKNVKKFNKEIKIIAITNNPIIKNDYEFDFVLTAAFINNYRMNLIELPSDSIILLIAACNLLFDKIYKINESFNSEFIEKGILKI